MTMQDTIAERHVDDRMFHSLSFEATQIVSFSIARTSSSLGVVADGRWCVPDHIDRGYLLAEDVVPAMAAVTIAKPSFNDYDDGTPDRVLVELAGLLAAAPDQPASDVWF